MEIILLERIPKLGQMGDTVSVKDGYARNFLLPQGKALRANKANLARFESERAQLEARNLERRTEAQAVADKLDGNAYIAVRSAGETGQLYGSVATRDIAAILEENGFTVGRNQVELNQPIKVIGLHEVVIRLHPEVEASVTINVARSEDEAERQAAGEDLTKREAFEFDIEDEDEDDDIDVDALFDNPEDAEAVAGDDAAEDGEEEPTT
ncbi:MAG: 50S ribosomal protein L9 [Pseudomonadota bacterium]